MRDGGILAIQNCTGLAQDCMGCMYGYLNACCVSSGLHEMTKAKKKVAAKPHNSLFLFCNMNRFGMAVEDKKWFYKLASSTLSYAVAVTKSLL